MSQFMTSEIMRAGAGTYFGAPAGVTGGMPMPGTLTPGAQAMFVGADGAGVGALAQQFNFGLPAPIQGGKIDLETSPVQYTYLCPPGGDDSDVRYAMPDMPAFSINMFDRDEGSTPIITLAKLNQYLYDAYNDFKRASDPSEPDSYADAIEFKRLLEKYGERGLETYHQARKVPHVMKYLEKKNVNLAELKDFYDKSSEDLFCWQTKFGILGKINYLGPILTVSRDVTLEAENNTMGMDHYCIFNVALAKRCTIANIFGDAEHVTTSTVLWLKLTRKEISEKGKIVFREFYVVPGGSKKESYPSQASLSYTDPSGRAMFGHRWCVGKVIVPGKRSPNPVAMANAANIGLKCTEKLAYEDHGTLPVLTIIAGFK
jgi:hypothetical protein